MRHVIIGNGPAGVVAAETIRKHRAHDEIVLIGELPGDLAGTNTFRYSYDGLLNVGVLTVTFVEVMPDMRQAKIHVSVMGGETKQDLALHGVAVRPPIDNRRTCR